MHVRVAPDWNRPAGPDAAAGSHRARERGRLEREGEREIRKGGRERLEREGGRERPILFSVCAQKNTQQNTQKTQKEAKNTKKTRKKHQKNAQKMQTQKNASPPLLVRARARQCVCLSCLCERACARACERACARRARACV